MVSSKTLFLPHFINTKKICFVVIAKYIFPLFLGLAVCLGFSSCKVLNPNVMFETPKDFDFVDLSEKQPGDYKIKQGDRLEINVFTNKGYKLVDALSSETASGKLMAGEIIYNVDANGTVRMPVIGVIEIEGKTVREAEMAMEEKYEERYVEPFVKISVTNRRVSVFRGNEEAVVVNLESDNVTLIEVLAKAGGIPETGKAHKIKLIRGDAFNPQVSVIDLSTVEGMSQANLVMEANDVIYIKSTINTGFIREVAAILGVATSAFVMYRVFTN